MVRLLMLSLCLLIVGLGMAADRPGKRSGGTRSAVLARNGMVATSQPLATAAGLRILQKGGNAVDAAVAAAAVLNVVEPMMTGIGGDLFAIVYMAKTGELRGLNASGRSAYAANIEFFKKKGYNRMPGHGVYSVSVPGTVDGWAKLLERYGTMSLAQVLEPAIEYAEEGFPVSEIISEQWRRFGPRFLQNEDFARTYFPNGKAPEMGQVFVQKNLAETLKKIARGGRDVFYKGEIAERIVKFIQQQGGLLTMKDFSDHTSTWVDPIWTTYRGYTVYELPPNCQGITVLEMLNILEGYDLKSLGHNSAEYLHLLVEAKKLAFADRDAFVADPEKAKVPVERLLSKEYAAQQRKRISLERAAPDRDLAPGFVPQGDTVYLTTADKDGNLVSLINSIFDAFGSGLVAGDTGICLQNRGSSFVLDERHPNRLEPHKRPFHTIIPAMVFKDGKPFLSFGVMGGDMQPQGHVQVLLNIIDFGMDVQEAGDAPRFRHSAEGLALESGIGHEVRRKLAEKGHRIISGLDVFGGYQAIMVDPKTGVLMGGSDPRKDGCAMGY